jgi:hypothetical protein
MLEGGLNRLTLHDLGCECAYEDISGPVTGDDIDLWCWNVGDALARLEMQDSCCAQRDQCVLGRNARKHIGLWNLETKQLLCFELIDHQVLELRKLNGRERAVRRCVEQHRNALLAAMIEHFVGRLGMRFKLRDHQARLEAFNLTDHHLRRQTVVGSRQDYGTVFTIGLEHGHAFTSGKAGYDLEIGRNAVRLEPFAGLLPGPVIADGGNQPGLHGFGCSQGLIDRLAAQLSSDGFATQRFARQWKTWHAQEVIDVNAAEDQDARHGLFPPKAFRPRGSR